MKGNRIPTQKGCCTCLSSSLWHIIIANILHCVNIVLCRKSQYPIFVLCRVDISKHCSMLEMSGRWYKPPSLHLSSWVADCQKAKQQNNQHQDLKQAVTGLVKYVMSTYINIVHCDICQSWFYKLNLCYIQSRIYIYCWICWTELFYFFWQSGVRPCNTSQRHFKSSSLSVSLTFSLTVVTVSKW